MVMKNKKTKTKTKNEKKKNYILSDRFVAKKGDFISY